MLRGIRGEDELESVSGGVKGNSARGIDDDLVYGLTVCLPLDFSDFMLLCIAAGGQLHYLWWGRVQDIKPTRDVRFQGKRAQRVVGAKVGCADESFVCREFRSV